MATFYDYFNEQKYADAVKNVRNVNVLNHPYVLLKLMLRVLECAVYKLGCAY